MKSHALRSNWPGKLPGYLPGQVCGPSKRVDLTCRHCGSLALSLSLLSVFAGLAVRVLLGCRYAQ
ncbi:MAG: hypothetical protein C0439_16210 [Pseudomonas sp.]|nr:hypothetical protein [Pseudomonas sp.]